MIICSVILRTYIFVVFALFFRCALFGGLQLLHCHSRLLKKFQEIMTVFIQLINKIFNYER
jgi:hypothetical protein